ncbi:hypothetical protein SDC9_107278 [bioreactor metagenome]|uniref:Uncharacterized protein n=1 Tax=bioreactor metagenome TaxID=1076179 RepID=A0A645B4V9_9ZZZZ
MSALGDLSQYHLRAAVHLARIGLARHRDSPAEPHLFRDHAVKRLHLLIVAVKQFQEGGLRARRSLGTQRPQVAQKVFNQADII